MGVNLGGLSAFKDRMHGVVEGRLVALGNAVAKEARRLAAVDTGEMKARVHVEVEPGKMLVRIVAGAPWSLFNEFGTSRMRARPFMRPALAQAGRLWRSLGNTELAFPETPEPYDLAPHRRTGFGRAAVTNRGEHVRGHAPGAPLGRITPVV